MKKLLVATMLLLLPVIAAARETEHVLSSDGRLFSIRAQVSSETPDVKTDSTQYLVLETRRGTEMTSEIIPASLNKGAHGNAAMAYDEESKTLFAFWLHNTGVTSSELVFASRDDAGAWSEPTTFGPRYNYRENLRIAVTRKTRDATVDKVITGLSVHAVWWEFDSEEAEGGWSAQYAILAIENGKAAEVNFLNLSRLVPGQKSGEPATGSILRYPQLFPAATNDSVVVVFGDVATNSIQRARIFPVKGHGRLRVPVGRHEGGMGAPGFNVAANSTVEGISGDDDALAFYVREGDQIRYIVHRNESWSDERIIALDAQVTSMAATDAIRRLLNH